MTDEEREAAIIADGKSYIAGSAGHATLEAVPTLSAAATQMSFAAAANQFNVLTRFGTEGANAVSIDDRARATAERRNEFESIFIRDGMISIDSNGGIRVIVEYLHAVEVIRAKAAALGYGAQSQTVPITEVPGGYVGRFGGNDIYAAAR